MTDETKNDGGPAFPSECEGHGNPQYHSPGMTLRDYFAVHAPNGPVTFPTTADAAKFVGIESPDPYDVEGVARMSAAIQVKLAYMYADAMLAERSK